MRNNLIKRIDKLKKLYAFTEKFSIDLSLSENPLGFSPNVLKVIEKESNFIKHYPDPNCSELKEVLVSKLGVSEEEIVVGNGSEQLISLLVTILIDKNDECIIPLTTFPLFERGVFLAGGKAVFSPMSKDLSIDLCDIKKRITKKTKVVFLCNPNNPTGKLLKKTEIVEFVKTISPVTVVVDEANIEFCGQTVVNEIKNIDNLVVLRTFSKAFGLAGLRIGVCLCNEKLAKVVNKIREPFAVNSISQASAVTALKDEDFILRTVKFMDKERAFLTEELHSRGFGVIESDANNLLIQVDSIFGSAKRLVKLLESKNVSVVGGNNFRGLEDKFIRISPQKRKTNIEFLKIIDELMNN